MKKMIIIFLIAFVFITFLKYINHYDFICYILSYIFGLLTQFIDD